MKTFIYIITFIAIAGCSEAKSYKFEPVTDVKVNVFIGEIKVDEEGNTYIQFKYEINNESKSKIRLHTENIIVAVNGRNSAFVHYNSLASALEVNIPIKQGVTEHTLYLMLWGKLHDGTIETFKVTDFGLIEE